MGIGERGVAVILPVEDAASLSECALHQTIPGGEHLVISRGRYTLMSRRIELGASASDGFAHCVVFKSQFGGYLSGSLRAMQDIVSLEVASLGDAPEFFGNGSVGIAKTLTYFHRRPDVELALNALA